MKTEDLMAKAAQAITSAFANDPLKQRQWAAFVGDLTEAPKELQTVISDLTTFLRTQRSLRVAMHSNSGNPDVHPAALAATGPPATQLSRDAAIRLMRGGLATAMRDVAASYMMPICWITARPASPSSSTTAHPFSWIAAPDRSSSRRTMSTRVSERQRRNIPTRSASLEPCAAISGTGCLRMIYFLSDV